MIPRLLLISISFITMIAHGIVFSTCAPSFFEKGHDIPCSKGRPVNILDFIKNAPQSLNLCYRCECPNSFIKCNRYNHSVDCGSRVGTKDTKKTHKQGSLTGSEKPHPLYLSTQISDSDVNSIIHELEELSIIGKNKTELITQRFSDHIVNKVIIGQLDTELIHLFEAPRRGQTLKAHRLEMV